MIWIGFSNDFACFFPKELFKLEIVSKVTKFLYKIIEKSGKIPKKLNFGWEISRKTVSDYNPSEGFQKLVHDFI